MFFNVLVLITYSEVETETGIGYNNPVIVV